MIILDYLLRLLATSAVFFFIGYAIGCNYDYLVVLFIR